MIDFVLGIFGGFFFSQIIYPLTHGKQSPAPETFGLVIGGLVVLFEMQVVGASKDAMRNAALSFASVGIGVGFSRVLMAHEL